MCVGQNLRETTGYQLPSYWTLKPLLLLSFPSAAHLQQQPPQHQTTKQTHKEEKQ